MKQDYYKKIMRPATDKKTSPEQYETKESKHERVSETVQRESKRELR